MGRRLLGLVVVAMCGWMVACSDGSDSGSSETTTTTTAASPPAALAAAVPAPESVTYLSEASIDTTGYWTGYIVDADAAVDLSAYGDRLEVLGWTAGDAADDSLSATMDGAWLQVAVAGDDVGVCVFNAEPDDGTCASFPSTLLDTTTTTAG